MKIFLDTSNPKDIEKYHSIGLIDGVTTNPSLIAKTDRNIFDVIKDIHSIIPDLPLSVEVVSEDVSSMLKEADKIRNISNNIVIKLPITKEGIAVGLKLKAQSTKLNFTLCFSLGQALMVAKIGADYVSPFVGRVDDIGYDGITLIEDIMKVYLNYQDLNTKIIVASIRGYSHIVNAMRIGADIATIPPQFLEMMIKHPLTDKGLEIFKNDWANSGQSII